MEPSLMKFSYAYASMKGGMITNIKKGDYMCMPVLVIFMRRLKSAMESSIPRYHRTKGRKLSYANHKVIDLKV